MIDPANAARDLLCHIDLRTEDFLQTVDFSLKICTNSKGDRYFRCDSKSSAKGGNFPSKNLREIEVLADCGFQSSLHQYFDIGVISCSVWGFLES
jgi:hypothetical protein